MKLDGNGITVAVLDSSINRHHAAFENNPLSGENFIHDDNAHKDYWYSNREEHGTMVAGIFWQSLLQKLKSMFVVFLIIGTRDPLSKKHLNILGMKKNVHSRYM